MKPYSKIQKHYLVCATSGVLYHGTDEDFKELKPNEYGIIWLTDDPEAAKRYARRSPILRKNIT